MARKTSMIPPAFVTCLAMLATTSSLAGEAPHYELSLSLDAARSQLHASVELKLPAALAGETISFSLANGLEIVASEPEVQVELPADDEGRATLPHRYQVTLAEGSRLLSLHYTGPLDHPGLDTDGQWPSGLLLTGSSGWYPLLDSGPFTFSLTASLPEGWHLLASGRGTSRDSEGRAHWQSELPVQQLLLAGGPLQPHRATGGPVELLVYLRQSDAGLARRYLDSAARWLELYGELLGPYPLEKLALVELAGDSRHAAPSLLALGASILRAPGTVRTDWPELIVAQWWSGGLQVDDSDGDWSPGLAAYLSRHLVAELEGRDAVLRADTLRELAETTGTGEGMVLRQFTAGRDPDTDEIGSARGLLGFHGLRLRLGDDVFRSALARFHEAYRGRAAGFSELQAVFEDTSGENLERFFREWLDRGDLPELALDALSVRETTEGWVLRGTLRQLQEHPLELEVPVTVLTSGEAVQRTLRTTESDTRFVIEAAARPLALAIDPASDLLRQPVAPAAHGDPSALLATLADDAEPPVLEYEAREPLAQLPVMFFAERLQAHVDWLADPARQGRGVGTPGLRDSARYIAEAFAAAGLEPGGPDGDWFQRFTMPSGPDGRPQQVKNVIGHLPGVNEAFVGQAAVLSAHYDHLGMGWPNVRADARGQLHPGADDNASGVAVLLELAHGFAAGPRPQRGLVFIAFTAEEAGLIGSRHYVRNPSPWPLEQLIAVVNLDTVGRLEGQPVSVLAADSAREWPFVFRGISWMTGIETRIIGGAAESSDQQAFIEAGVPGVQLFTQAHEDYHRPTDTADRIDAKGMVRVAIIAREAANYLATTLQPPTPAAPAGAAQAEPAARRRVSLGTVPDFGFGGPGMRVEAVVPGSPAANAGLAAGDIVVRMDGQEVEGLSGFNQLLGGFEPGQTIGVEWLRDGTAMKAEVELVER